MDQDFRHNSMDLCHLKMFARKEAPHLTMVLVLDEDHMHYSDTFRNILEEETLHKKFPSGLNGVMMNKGTVANAIVCHFCPLHMFQ